MGTPLSADATRQTVKLAALVGAVTRRNTGCALKLCKEIGFITQGVGGAEVIHFDVIDLTLEGRGVGSSIRAQFLRDLGYDEHEKRVASRRRPALRCSTISDLDDIPAY